MAQKNTVNMHKLINITKGLYKSMEREWDEYAQRYGMTNAHLHVLWILSLHDGLKLSELADKGVWNLSTTHDIVTRMAGKGFVKKVKDVEDGRVTRVYITKEGQKLRDKTQDDFDHGYSFKLMKVIDKLNEADKDKLMDILNVIAKQVLDEDFVNYVESSCERLNEDDTN